MLSITITKVHSLQACHGNWCAAVLESMYVLGFVCVSSHNRGLCGIFTQSVLDEGNRARLKEIGQGGCLMGQLENQVKKDSPPLMNWIAIR